MGWLRKVGRKISKRLGKIFGSKLGAVVGAVGLYMLMGPVAKSLTGWAKSAFGGAAKAGATTATQTAATAASDAAAAEAIAASGIQSTGASAKLSETALLAGENLSTQALKTSATNQTVAGQIANATNNMDVANSAISAIDSAALSGSTNVAPTITDSLINEALPALDQNAATVKANVIEMGETVTTAPRVSPMDVVTETINTDASLVANQNIAAPKIDFTSDPTFIGEGISDTALPTPEPNIFEKGFDKVKELGTAAYEGVTSGNFVGDVTKGVTTGLIMGELQGDYEEPFRSAGIAAQPISEAAQANYIQAVAPSTMAATGMTRIPSFQELSQQTLYGTGSPNYLSQFYQPLATPSIG